MRVAGGCAGRRRHRFKRDCAHSAPTLPVSPTAVGHANDIDDAFIVSNRVNDTVVTDSNAPELGLASELLCAVWSRFAGQSENRGVDALSNASREDSEVLRG